MKASAVAALHFALSSTAQGISSGVIAMPENITVHRRNFPTAGMCGELMVNSSQSKHLFKDFHFQHFMPGTCQHYGYSKESGTEKACSPIVSGESWCMDMHVYEEDTHRGSLTIYKVDFPHSGECGEITLDNEDARDKARLFGFDIGNCSAHGFPTLGGHEHECQWEFPCSFWCDDFTVYLPPKRTE